MNQPMLDSLQMEDARLKKRSVRLQGHDTSVSMESIFWDELRRLAKDQGLSLNALVTQVDEARIGSLSGALRLYVINDLKSRLKDD